MISNCGTFHLTSLKEVKYIKFDACDVRNVITKINPEYMILVTVDFMLQVFQPYLQITSFHLFYNPLLKVCFFYQPTLLINQRNYQPMARLPAISRLPFLVSSYNQSCESMFLKHYQLKKKKFECLISRTKKSQNTRKYTKILPNVIQLNVSRADRYGAEVFVRFREVSTLKRFELKSSQI